MLIAWRDDRGVKVVVGITRISRSSETGMVIRDADLLLPVNFAASENFSVRSGWLHDEHIVFVIEEPSRMLSGHVALEPDASSRLESYWAKTDQLLGVKNLLERLFQEYPRTTVSQFEKVATVPDAAKDGVVCVPLWGAAFCALRIHVTKGTRCVVVFDLPR